MNRLRETFGRLGTILLLLYNKHRIIRRKDCIFYKIYFGKVEVIRFEKDFNPFSNV